MSKNKTYSVLIISLLVINTLLVGFVVLKPKRPLGKENKNPKEIIIKKLQFNEAQIIQYTSLVKQHIMTHQICLLYYMLLIDIQKTFVDLLHMS